MKNHNVLKEDGKEAKVVTKALRKAVKIWGLENKELSRIVRVSPSTISRLMNGTYHLNPKKPEWEFALLFLRLFRGLDAFMGGHEKNEVAWLRSNNKALGGAPLDLMQESVERFVQVLQYTDAIRGR